MCLFIFHNKIGLQCWIQGQCNGDLLNASDGTTENECLGECQANEDCVWFTHDSNGGQCELMADCPTFDTSCDTCLSSHVLCSEYEPDGPLTGKSSSISFF